MAEIKTKKNDASVADFLDSIENKQKREDGFRLVEIFEDATGEVAKMRWESIIWFGSYHYKSERSTQEWDWPLTWFSPRKANISLYIMWWLSNYTALIQKLGKCKLSKWSCVYIKKLEDIDIKILGKLIKASVKIMKKNYSV